MLSLIEKVKDFLSIFLQAMIAISIILIFPFLLLMVFTTVCLSDLFLYVAYNQLSKFKVGDTVITLGNFWRSKQKGIIKQVRKSYFSEYSISYLVKLKNKDISKHSTSSVFCSEKNINSCRIILIEKVDKNLSERNEYSKDWF